MARRKVAEVFVDVTGDGKPDRVVTYRRKHGHGHVANVQVNVKVPFKSGKKTMFAPAKSKKWARIISIETPAKARAACKALSKGWRKLTRAQKVKRIRYAVLAMNRAAVMLRKRNLSAKERKELKQVVAIYREWIDKHRFG